MPVDPGRGISWHPTRMNQFFRVVFTILEAPDNNAYFYALVIVYFLCICGSLVLVCKAKTRWRAMQ
jgi:hypothetical protein